MPKTYTINKIPSNLDPRIKTLIRNAKTEIEKLFPDFSYQYQIERDNNYWINYWLKYDYHSWETIAYYYENDFAMLVKNEQKEDYYAKFKPLENTTLKELTDLNYKNQDKAWCPYKHEYNLITRTDQSSVSKALAKKDSSECYFDQKLAFILNVKLTKKELTIDETRQLLKYLSNLLSKTLKDTNLIAHTLQYMPLKTALEIAKGDFKILKRNRPYIEQISKILILLASGRRINQPTTAYNTLNLDEDSIKCLQTLTKGKGEAINPQLFTPNLYDLKGNKINWN